VRNHEDLEVWQNAHALTIALYRLTEPFSRSEMFGLTSQIRRAAASIGASLAEGCGRWGETEMARFVQISMGSASELHNHLRLSHDLGFLSPAQYSSASKDLTSVRQMLTAFLQSLRGVRGPRQTATAFLAKGE
jgi:four helix bundle protein